MSYEDRIIEEMQAHMATAREGTEKFPVRAEDLDFVHLIGTVGSPYSNIQVGGWSMNDGTICLHEIYFDAEQMQEDGSIKKIGRIALNHNIYVDPGHFVWLEMED